MSLDERSPKRQRRSYSPPSPPGTKSVFVAQHPHTPPPSVHMSPSWNAQTSSLQQGGSVTFPTPPSTAGYHGAMTGKGLTSEASVESVGGTPADSTGRRDGDGDVELAGGVEAGHRRTDHERQAEGSGPTSGAGAVSGKLPGLFKLPSKPIARQRPHPSEDMLGLYSLRGIQTSVQRKDPLTGEKINKLRKSYEGKLRDLDLQGRNRATESKGELLGLVDPGWDDIIQEGLTRRQAVFGQYDLDGSMKNDLLANLDGALAVKAGQLPKKEHSEWRHALGLDDPKDKPAPAGPQKSATVNLLAKTAPGVGLLSSAPASPRMIAGRERKGKKRRYDDSSFEGYEDGYSTGGMDDTVAGKRRRRTVDPA